MLEDPAIRVRGPEKSYGTLEVPQGVNFDVVRESISLTSSVVVAHAFAMVAYRRKIA
jgi:hypothetical protein